MFKNLLNSLRRGPRSPAPTPDTSAQEAELLIAAGNAAEDAGQLEHAHERYLRAVALAPALARAHLNLGIAQEGLGDADAARASYERVLALEAGHPFGAYNLGKLDYLQGRLPAAEALLRQAVARKPDFADAWVLLSNVLDAMGNTVAAADAIGEGLRIRPDYPGALYNQAVVLRRLGRIDAAQAALARAVALGPDARVLALHSLLLIAQGCAAEALEPLRRAIALQPESFELRSRELLLLNLLEGVAAEELFQRHRALGAEVEAAVPAHAHPPGDAARRRLRLGFVSGDLRGHPVALFLLPVLEQRTRERFEVSCYSSTAVPDAFTQRLREASDHWIEAATWSDAQLTEAIAADGIDILVDLGGHSGEVRLGVFAGKPAPLQVAWVGYLNTTGLTRMDWRLTDARSDPPQLSQPLHTERLLLLPHSQWCYRPFAVVEAAEAAPCERNGFVTFGSFNNVMKLTPQMAQRWGALLQALPTARLLVAGVGSERKQAGMLAAIVQAGGSAERVEFAPRTDLEAYYRLMNRVDIALDSYPYGGGTTTFDALWMGVPVLTATGDIPASRSAASILAPLGLHQWIAPGIDAYTALAVQRAGDREAIAQLRRSLRARLQASPLMDEPAFVTAFEAALEQAWQAHCAAGGAPAAPAELSRTITP